MTVGVFDSGKGGELLAAEIAEAFPDHQVIVELDVKNVPYGLKTPDEIYSLTKTGLIKLEERGADVLVLACNTASTIIHRLREVIQKPIIGLEPMIKPAAAMTASGKIAVFATPATLASEKYQSLKAGISHDVRVLEPDCSKWSTMIQRDAIDWGQIAQVARTAVEQGADVLVLGCTHYHILEDFLVELVGVRALVLQPSESVIEQIRLALS